MAIIGLIVTAVLLVVALGCIYYGMILALSGSRAPFIPLPRTALDAVADALQMSKSSIFYDLGCGDGRIITDIYTRYRPSIVGIEKNWLAITIARLSCRDIPRNRLQLMKNDFMQVDLSQATHVFTFLMPKPMQGLEPKLLRELKPGAKLVSADFPLPNTRPSNVIDVDHSGDLVKKLYVYEF